ncbi:hypothetical protein E6B08_22500 [Pseudomonas putida]|uniref:Uncharacterized protein n=1 Tax=Pseudomonas putida TaxID=303 RepID=A0A4D6XDZ6_PSEPU|nr:hypothetical protein E6B08_22500 [Pseudomonas putida]
MIGIRGDARLSQICRFFAVCAGPFAGKPAPTGISQLSDSTQSCRSGFTRERARTDTPNV